MYDSWDRTCVVLFFYASKSVMNNYAMSDSTPSDF